MPPTCDSDNSACRPHQPSIRSTAEDGGYKQARGDEQAVGQDGEEVEASRKDGKSSHLAVCVFKELEGGDGAVILLWKAHRLQAHAYRILALCLGGEKVPNRIVLHTQPFHTQGGRVDGRGIQE